MHIRKLLFTIILLPFAALAQNTDTITSKYPQNYFRNPLDIPIFLAGNFGECRPGHFHSGTDIKTLGKENQPVHAAADGYISRIKMEKSGFGHALYITHPNGYTTLYAHLNDFAPAIQKYVRAHQYEQKKWDIDLQLSPATFPVKKGQQIAWSGNTGASTAPHLHFEIRNTKTEHPLNPELFGLPIIDKIPPKPRGIIIYNGSEPIYVNVQSEQKLAICKNGSYTISREYSSGDTVLSVPATLAGIGVEVDDYMDGSDNTINFLRARLYMDDTLQSEVTLDDIGYDVTRYVNAYADYATHQKTGKWIQLLYKLPGNHLDSIYTFLNKKNGRLDIHDWKTHKVRIDITDDKGNTSVVDFALKRMSIIVDPAVGPITMFSANKENKFANEDVSFVLDEKQLYDDVEFDYKKTPAPELLSDKLQLHHAYVPVHHYFDLRIKAHMPVPERLSGKVAMMYNDSKETDGRAATSTGDGWYKAPARAFGDWWLDYDTTAPVIKGQAKNGADLAHAKQILLTAKDAMTSVKKFNGYIDGKWVCFEQHGSAFFYKFDEHCSKGRHELLFEAEDENGNKADYSLKFTR